ncbi:MAG: hypothetical protein IT422_05350 [Pirellulaceae bacterium]|nr:hypothetical protein [Pirellulaceae bacterium]
MKTMKMFLSALPLAIVFSLVVATSSFAQTIPFLVVGSGNAPGGFIPLAPEIPMDHNTENGWAIKLGDHTGDGALQLVAPPDLANLTAQFSSIRPYRFVSSANPTDVLACNYGITTGSLPAASLGQATFYSIDDGADPSTPFDDTFIARFVAEFRPALEECSGKFDPSRLKNGSFTMYAFTAPVKIDAVNGIVVDVNSTPENLIPISYSWFGFGTLKFKWPFGWL